MPLETYKVAQAIQSGLSAVCATCLRYWEGRDKGLPEPQCTAKSDCGSPLVGDDFSEYAGPLPDFSTWCFVCAGEARYGVSLPGRKRVVGVCSKHADLLSALRATSVRGSKLSATDVLNKAVLLNPSGSSRPVVPAKKTLQQEMAEFDERLRKRS